MCADLCNHEQEGLSFTRPEERMGQALVDLAEGADPGQVLKGQPLQSRHITRCSPPVDDMRFCYRNKAAHIQTVDIEPHTPVAPGLLQNSRARVAIVAMIPPM